MAKVLVTGCAGYIGDMVVGALLLEGHEIVGVDNLTYVDAYRRTDDNLQFVNMDVTTDAFSELLFKKKPDAIVHLAAIVGDGACAVDKELTYRVNVESVNRIIRHLGQFPKTRFVFPSTCSVYGDNDTLIDEESSVNPLSLYAETKLIAEDNIKRNAPPNYVIFRLGTVYGLSSEFARIRADLVANILTYKACDNKPLSVFGGDQWRPMISVADVGCILAEAVSAKYRGTFILSAKNYTIADLAKKIKEITKSDSTLEFTEMKTEDLRNYRVDNSKAVCEDILTYFDLGNEITEMAEFYKAGRVKDIWDSRYNNAKFMKEKYGK